MTAISKSFQRDSGVCDQASRAIHTWSIRQRTRHFRKQILVSVFFKPTERDFLRHKNVLSTTTLRQVRSGYVFVNSIVSKTGTITLNS